MKSKNATNPPIEKKLHRSKQNRVIAGVAGGLGDYFNIDPTIFRILFIIFTVFGGSGILIYLLMWLIVPTDKNSAINLQTTSKEILAEAKKLSSKINEQSTQPILAIVLILLGIYFLLNNLGLISWSIWKTIIRFWPFVLILFGASLLKSNQKLLQIAILTFLISILTAAVLFALSQSFADINQLSTFIR